MDAIRLQSALLASIQERDAAGAREAAARHKGYIDDLLGRSLEQPRGLLGGTGEEYA